MPTQTTVFAALHRAFSASENTAGYVDARKAATVAHDAITEYAGGSWSVVHVLDEDRPAAVGDPLVYDPEEVVSSLRSREYYGTDATNTLMGQAANLLASIWSDRATEAVPEGAELMVVFDDDRLQAIADLTKQAREDAAWRSTVTSALVGYNSSSVVTAEDAEKTIRSDRRILAKRADFEEALERVGDLLTTYQMREGTVLYYADGNIPAGPAFTSALARDVYVLIHPEATR
jgi:hypothetical protein